MSIRFAFLLPAFVGLALSSGPALAQPPRPGAATGAMADYHVHVKGDLTLEDALRRSRETGISYGIAINGGLNFPVNSDAGLEPFLVEMRGKPAFKAFQAEGREWVRLFTSQALEKFDYVFTDSMTWTDDNGKRMRLWIKAEVGVIADPQTFMDTLVNRATGIFANEPIDIYVNPTFIPEQIAADYDKLWTPRRMKTIVDGLAANGIAMEINNRYRIPSAAFIRLAKQSGVKFACGTNNTGAADLGRNEYCAEMIRACDLRAQDFWSPPADGKKAVQRKPLPRQDGDAGAQSKAPRPETATGSPSVPPAAMTPWPSPAAAGSLAPQLAVAPDGRVYLSWLEPAAGGIMRFRLAERTADAWNQLPDIAAGPNLFANWADVPSVFASANGTLIAHWLQRTGTSTYAYGIRMRASFDRGRTWSPAISPHRDESPTEHGFLSFFDAPDGAIGMVWLDGRQTAASSSAGDGHGHGGGGAMTLRATTFGSGLTLGPDVLVDGRVCDCCPTAAVRTSRGAIVAYRDRSAREVRDIGIARLERGAWKPGGVIHADGWTIAGCPVNGPALAATGDTVALAWFTAAGDQGRARLALSQDGGASFGAPVRVDDEGSMGRVDVEALPDGSAVVLWIEFANARAEVRMRRIWPDGRRGMSMVVSGVSADRSSGNPRLVRNGNDLVIAWRSSGPTPQIHVAATKVPLG